MATKKYIELRIHFSHYMYAFIIFGMRQGAIACINTNGSASRCYSLSPSPVFPSIRLPFDRTVFTEDRFLKNFPIIIARERCYD